MEIGNKVLCIDNFSGHFSQTANLLELEKVYTIKQFHGPYIIELEEIPGYQYGVDRFELLDTLKKNNGSKVVQIAFSPIGIICLLYDDGSIWHTTPDGKTFEEFELPHKTQINKPTQKVTQSEILEDSQM